MPIETLPRPCSPMDTPRPNGPTPATLGAGVEQGKVLGNWTIGNASRILPAHAHAMGRGRSASTSRRNRKGPAPVRDRAFLFCGAEPQTTTEKVSSPQLSLFSPEFQGA